jgi:hypothetical protein
MSLEFIREEQNLIDESGKHDLVDRIEALARFGKKPL